MLNNCFRMRAAALYFSAHGFTSRTAATGTMQCREPDTPMRAFRTEASCVGLPISQQQTICCRNSASAQLNHPSKPEVYKPYLPVQCPANQHGALSVRLAAGSLPGTRGPHHRNLEVAMAAVALYKEDVLEQSTPSRTQVLMRRIRRPCFR